MWGMVQIDILFFFFGYLEICTAKLQYILFHDINPWTPKAQAFLTISFQNIFIPTSILLISLRVTLPQ